MPRSRKAPEGVDPSVEFEGYDVTRFTLKLNAKELSIDDALHWGDYVVMTVRGRVGKIIFEPAADGTLGRVHPVSASSVRVESASRTVDPNQAALFGEPVSDEGEEEGEDPKADHIRKLQEPREK
jgi:hypothetical protein